MTLICDVGAAGSGGGEGSHMDWRGKKGGEGAEKLTLDISHLNAAAIIIHITVKLSDADDGLNVQLEAFLPLPPFFFIGIISPEDEISPLVGNGLDVNKSLISGVSQPTVDICRKRLNLHNGTSSLGAVSISS